MLVIASQAKADQPLTRILIHEREVHLGMQWHGPVTVIQHWPQEDWWTKITPGLTDYPQQQGEGFEGLFWNLPCTSAECTESTVGTQRFCKELLVYTMQNLPQRELGPGPLCPPKATPMQRWHGPTWARGQTRLLYFGNKISTQHFRNSDWLSLKPRYFKSHPCVNWDH